MANYQLSNIQPGLTFTQDGICNILVWAPLAQSVNILLTDTGKKIELNAGEHGYWQLSTTEVQHGDLYKVVLNNEKQLPDPASRAQPQGVHGPSQVIDVNGFKWTDNQWANPALEQYLIYELHTGTFSPEGTFAGITEKLQYLKELGITAIEIMPVAQFPGNRNWGYDGVFPYAVQNSYGGPAGLMELVDACHKKGLAVILDVVYNHVGPEGNYLNEFGQYFTDKYNTPWGNAINFDDAHCDEVRNFFKQNVLMWFRDFHVDALRMDAVHAIKDFSPKHILQEIKESVDELMADTGRKHYLIIEFDLNDKRFIDPLPQGYGMDGQWIDEFHHALRVTAGGERNGYYADFSGISDLAKAYRDAYVYDGQYSPHRQKKFGTKTDNPGQQFVVFSQNHDHVGNRLLGERSSVLFSFEMQKLLAGAVMVVPYLPMLFMGEEYAEQNPFQYFVSHTDEDMIAAVRKGRKEEFKAFHAEGEAPDPQSEETFRRSALNWDSIHQQQHKTMLHYYKTLIVLRKQSLALATLNRHQLEVSCDQEQQTLWLHRWEGDEHVYCFMNFSDKVQQLALPADGPALSIILDSADPEFGGQRSTSVRGGEAEVILPESIIIYTNQNV
ncbi:malto-oligosyltrehalose trehalohydrolase [Mucilaginibacter terrenus]|uniref:Malto-oligosyltrehalose trehalohydrolase n=1 Tax=Mucilaginibacter terrenus TaxID=2482727 RepID=A0A3E2NVK6_9SPHI|nr:malto-oligosyltrehalose trehalohydrolase [Mucilaginibacter terrenus]RFZ85053.1 malto-oligosyltrehalose trehalohydrolase [Mucilaginibacter terrenus]